MLPATRPLYIEPTLLDADRSGVVKVTEKENSVIIWKVFGKKPGVSHITGELHSTRGSEQFLSRIPLVAKNIDPGKQERRSRSGILLSEKKPGKRKRVSYHPNVEEEKIPSDQSDQQHARHTRPSTPPVKHDVELSSAETSQGDSKLEQTDIIVNRIKCQEQTAVQCAYVPQCDLRGTGKENAARFDSYELTKLPEFSSSVGETCKNIAKPDYAVNHVASSPLTDSSAMDASAKICLPADAFRQSNSSAMSSPAITNIMGNGHTSSPATFMIAYEQFMKQHLQRPPEDGSTALETADGDTRSRSDYEKFVKELQNLSLQENVSSAKVVKSLPELSKESKSLPCITKIVSDSKITCVDPVKKVALSKDSTVSEICSERTAEFLEDVEKETNGREDLCDIVSSFATRSRESSFTSTREAFTRLPNKYPEECQPQKCYTFVESAWAPFRPVCTKHVVSTGSATASRKLENAETNTLPLSVRSVHTETEEISPTVDVNTGADSPAEDMITIVTPPRSVQPLKRWNVSTKIDRPETSSSCSRKTKMVRRTRPVQTDLTFSGSLKKAVQTDGKDAHSSLSSEDPINKLEEQISNLVDSWDIQECDMASLYKHMDFLSKQLEDVKKSATEDREMREFVEAERWAMKESLREAELRNASKDEECQSLHSSLHQMTLKCQQLEVELEATRCRTRHMAFSHDSEIHEANCIASAVQRQTIDLLTYLADQLEMPSEDLNNETAISDASGVNNESVLAEPLDFSDSQQFSLVASVMNAVNDQSQSLAKSVILRNATKRLFDSVGQNANTNVMDQNDTLDASNFVPVCKKQLLAPSGDSLPEPSVDSAFVQVGETSFVPRTAAVSEEVIDAEQEVDKSDDKSKQPASETCTLSQQKPQSLANKLKHLSNDIYQLQYMIEMLVDVQRNVADSLIRERDTLLAKQNGYELRVTYLTQDVRSLEREKENLQKEILDQLDELHEKNRALAHTNNCMRLMGEKIEQQQQSQSSGDTSALVELSAKLCEKEVLIQEIQLKAQERNDILKDNWKKAEETVYLLDEKLEELLKVVESIPDLPSVSPQLHSLVNYIRSRERFKSELNSQEE